MISKVDLNSRVRCIFWATMNAYVDVFKFFLMGHDKVDIKSQVHRSHFTKKGPVKSYKMVLKCMYFSSGGYKTL